MKEGFLGLVLKQLRQCFAHSRFTRFLIFKSKKMTAIFVFWGEKGGRYSLSDLAEIALNLEREIQEEHFEPTSQASFLQFEHFLYVYVKNQRLTCQHLVQDTTAPLAAHLRPRRTRGRRSNRPFRSPCSSRGRFCSVCMSFRSLWGKLSSWSPRKTNQPSGRL